MDNKRLNAEPAGDQLIKGAVAELQASPVPDGVDPVVYGKLTQALAESLLAREAAGIRTASAMVEARDRLYRDNFDGTITISWTYHSTGDYDQNSEVNIGDLTPIGMNFNETDAGASWDKARLADGDENGEVNIGDVTPIGMHFGTTVEGFNVETTPSIIVPNWTLLVYVPFSAGAVPPGGSLLSFATTQTIPVPGSYYRITPVMAAAPNQNPTAVLATNRTSGTPPLVIDFDASGSTDSDGSIVKYEWDWTGDGTYDLDTGATPTTNYVYNLAAGDYSATVRVTDDRGGTDTDTVVITVTDTGFVVPPVEIFQDFSQAGDSVTRQWLLNCYAPLPAWQDSDRAYQSAYFTAFADEVLAITNTERANQGLSALARDPHLELCAQAHARDMALRSFFAHANPYGMSSNDRMVAIDIAPWFRTAENIAAGIDMNRDNSPAMIMDLWMNSPGHRANILEPDLTHIGIGVYYLDGDPEGYTIYWVQNFAQFQGDPDSHDWIEPQEVN